MLNFLFDWCQLRRGGPCDSGLWDLDSKTKQTQKENEANEIQFSIFKEKAIRQNLYHQKQSYLAARYSSQNCMDCCGLKMG